RSHRSDGPKANHALTFKVHHSSGAGEQNTAKERLFALFVLQPDQSYRSSIRRYVLDDYGQV
ncbi:hypothetical protein, partial [Roseobacter litoralis]|uniref:hypothetical protein n=1 Tax=Roseobacter litoralis TaxID=42443 RepID=UPI0024924A69